MTTGLHVSAIQPKRLDRIRSDGHDESGHPLAPFTATGGEPLRCCLSRAPADEPVMLISYSPFTERSPWAETGPVYVHAETCGGYQDADALPADLRTGPRVLKTYDAHGGLDYADITVIGEGRDIEAPLLDLLSRPTVAAVHVRALAAQCFTYVVTRTRSGVRPER
jgi:Protein of unknown function (DUF1203)